MLKDTAILSNEGNMTVFQFGDQRIRFRSPERLESYLEVRAWERGYIEVLTQYRGIGAEEEYIDLLPILRNLYIDPDKFLGPIKNVIIKSA